MKVGITIQLNRNGSFQSNGMLQNLYFLADLLDNIVGWECFFLYKSDYIPDLFISPEKCISIDSYLKHSPFEFDVLILGGYTGKVFTKSIFRNTKLIVLHCGARLMDDLFRCLHEVGNDSIQYSFPDDIQYDEVWTLPQHTRNIPYLSTIYNTKNVKVMPYIWDSKFIDLLISKHGYLKRDNFIHQLRSSRFTNLNIYEPNNTICKTSLLPLAIAVEHNRHGKNQLQKCNIFCADKIANSKYFVRMCHSLGIHAAQDYFSFHKRIEFVSSLRSFGIHTIVASHQIMVELNYLYLESLYLGLPLLHNSNILSSYGYYYPDSDTVEAARQIDCILNEHNVDFDNKDVDNIKLLYSYNPKNPKNISTYKESIIRLFQEY